MNGIPGSARARRLAVLTTSPTTLMTDQEREQDETAVEPKAIEHDVLHQHYGITRCTMWSIMVPTCAKLATEREEQR